MRTPVVLVAGQGDTDAVTGALLRRRGTLVVEHRFDGHVVRRTTITLQHRVLTTAETDDVAASKNPPQRKPSGQQRLLLEDSR